MTEKRTDRESAKTLVYTRVKIHTQAKVMKNYISNVHLTIVLSLYTTLCLKRAHVVSAHNFDMSMIFGRQTHDTLQEICKNMV